MSGCIECANRTASQDFIRYHAHSESRLLYYEVHYPLRYENGQYETRSLVLEVVLCYVSQIIDLLRRFRPYFNNDVLRNTLKIEGISIDYSPSSASKSIGIIKLSNKLLKQVLRKESE